ncbi:MAG: response regulator [Candidatus Omnitrophota bacterium]|jgi:DNA-binding NtrC family response regulator|nr:MAG: response regulator [Candidatus Omnitrophota bacterium]
MNSNTELIHLLLVDDEEEFLQAASRALERRNFVVSAAPNGITALEMIKTESFDVVVLDVKMPDIDGIEVFEQIRNSYPELPVIILTGHPSIADAFTTSKNGIADYLSKPVDMDQLAQKVRQVFTEAKKNAAGNDAMNGSTDAAGPIRVLIVDDETELLDSLQKIFTRRKMITFTANSGAAALELLKDKLVDVMILDVKMPEMDGLEVLRRVKEKYPSIQIILLSGHPSVEAAVKGVKLGANEYMKKPPDIRELVRTVAHLYQQRHDYLEEQQKKLIDDIIQRFPD